MPSLQRDNDCDSLSIPDLSEDIIAIEQTPQKNEDATDSTIAWGALAMLLGSPAPSCIATNRKHKTESKNLWAEDALDENDELISLEPSPDHDKHSDESSLPSLSPHNGLVEEPLFSDVELDFSDSTPPNNDKDAANSAIVWTALTALLSSPAPSCVLRRKAKRTDTLWEDCDASIDDIDLVSLAHSESLIDNATRNNDKERDKSADIDLDLSALDIDPDTPRHILDNTKNAEVTPQKTKDITNSTIAWTALTALLGSPAPSCVFQKSAHPGKNLWADDSDEGDDLLSLASSQASVSVPSLIAESAPSSPLIRNTSSFESSSPERDSAVMETFIEWTH